MKQSLPLWAAAVSCLASVACSSDAEVSSSDDKVTIGWLAKGSMNDFFELSRHAAQRDLL